MNNKQIGSTNHPRKVQKSNAEVSRIAKAKRDGERLKGQARYVLVLDSNAQAIQLIHNHPYFANIIAVLAPSNIHGVFLPETLILEIGISRTRPYKATEKVTWTDKKKSTRRFTLREKVRSMEESEFVTVWQYLEKLFCSATFQTRYTWKPETKREWWVNTVSGPIPFERGVYFTVSKDDVLLYTQILKEDLRTRRRYLRVHANNINRWLRRYKLLSYSDTKLRSLRGAIKAIDLWKNISPGPRLAGEILRLMNHHTRDLFLDVLRAFRLHDPTTEEEAPAFLSVSQLKNSRVRVVRESGKIHGKGCIIFEHFFEEGYRANNDV